MQQLQGDKKVSTADTTELTTGCVGPLFDMSIFLACPSTEMPRRYHRQALHRYTCLCKQTVR